MKHVPNLFTLLNLVFGCLAIVVILQNGITVYHSAEGDTWIDMPEQIWWAALFIALAAVVDFLDGFIARLFKATSELGKQLDSLADLVSFGVAPGMIVYQFLRLSFAGESNALDQPLLWLTPAFLLPMAAAYRLARFNIDTSQTFSFKGLPVPANGLFFATLPLVYWQVETPWIHQLLLNKWFLYALVLAFSWLMVSRLPLMAFKFKGYAWGPNRYKYLLLLVSAAAIVLMGWLAAPFILGAYILLSFLHAAKA